MAESVEMVLGRWYRFRTSDAYPKLTRIGELVDTRADSLHGTLCRFRARRGPTYVVPAAQVIAELRVEDVL